MNYKQCFREHFYHVPNIHVYPYLLTMYMVVELMGHRLSLSLKDTYFKIQHMYRKVCKTDMSNSSDFFHCVDLESIQS